jgi:site-specific recombinase XerD
LPHFDLDARFARNARAFPGSSSIAADAGAERARCYTDRIVTTCRNLVTFPERGTRRDDLRPGLRTRPIAAASPSPTTSPTRRSSLTAFSMAGGLCRRCSPKATMAKPDRVARDTTPQRRTQLTVAPAPALLPTPLFAPTPRAARRFVEFFTAQINNDHTRKAYLNATQRFAAWCEIHSLHQLADVQPFHAASFVKDLQSQFSPPTVKQHLAAIRMLFDWLATCHVMETNPAHAVRGPKYVVKKGKTRVLTTDEARAFLDAIPTDTLTGLRDRALIGVMIYTFARVNAAIKMKVMDYFTQGCRGWVRLHEKGGKEHEVPCHHALERFLDEYIAAAGIAGDGALFRTTGRKTGQAQALWQQDAYRMIQRRAAAAGIKTRIGNHTFRVIGITAYPKNNGLLDHAQSIANYASPRTTKLYDRRSDEISRGGDCNLSTHADAGCIWTDFL